MSDLMIENGDVVEVVLFIGTTYGESFHGEVVSRPCATGDCWVIKRPDGALHYIQNFVQIVRRKG